MSKWIQFRDIEPGEKIVAFADTAAGGLDFCAIQFMSTTKLDIPLVYHDKVIATIMTNEAFPVFERIAEVTGFKPLIAYERNNGGSFEMDRLASLNRQGLFEVFRMPTIGIAMHPQDSMRLGWDTNTATRPQMLGGLKEAIDAGLLTIYHQETVKELYSFVVVKTTSSWKAQAESGSHDDLVMALAGVWQLYLTNHQFNVSRLERRQLVGYSGGMPGTGYKKVPVYKSDF